MIFDSWQVRRAARELGRIEVSARAARREGVHFSLHRSRRFPTEFR